MQQLPARRRFRTAVSIAALLSLNVTALPSSAPAFGRHNEMLDACATQREPLVKLDDQYREMKRSKMSQAIGEGLKKGATVIAMGVMNGGLSNIAHGGGFGGGLGGFGAFNPLGAVAGMAAQQAMQHEAQASGAPAQPAASPAGLTFGQDLLSGALGLQVPGVSGYAYAGDNMKAYAALAVLVAIVATAEAYAQLKAQEAGGDLHKASTNIDEDAARQLAVSRQIADSGSQLVACRSQQLNDINSRLASASNDKDRQAIKRQRTELNEALKQDVDLTGDVVDQHVNMAKTFTRGRAMTDGTSEAQVLGGQAPAYEEVASTQRLSMPANGVGGGAVAPTQTAAAPEAAPTLVALKATVVRSAPVASAAVLMTFPAGRRVQPKSAHAAGGWWEIDVAGSSGYVRAADLRQNGAAALGSGDAGAVPATAGPSNIRAYNESVIVARNSSKSRLSSLMTDIQTSERRESVLYALLTYLNLA